MKLFSKCDKCHKRSLFIRYWTFNMPYQKKTMKSQSMYCMKCAYELKKGFDMMKKSNEQQPN